MKKVFKVISICFIAICLLGNVVFAYSDQSSSFTFNTFATGNGYVSGDETGVYYSLTPGSVSLQITSYSVKDSRTNQSIETGACYVDLVKGTSHYGTQTISDTGSYAWSVNADSTNYFLSASGVSPCTYRIYSVSGTMHDHS
ncbi:MAG TPA: hypothetical protein VIK78_02995 [Ruminiclostridium sp.]